MFDFKDTPQPGIEPGSPEGRGFLFSLKGDVVRRTLVLFT